MNAAPSPIRILLVHDQQLVRAGLRLLLEREPDFYIMAEAANVAQTLEAATAQPDIIILNLKSCHYPNLFSLSGILAPATKSLSLVIPRRSVSQPGMPSALRFM